MGATVPLPPLLLTWAWASGGAHSPQGLLPAPQVILQDDAGHRAPLPHTRAVADEEAGPLPAGEQDLVLLRAKEGRSGSGGLPLPRASRVPPHTTSAGEAGDPRSPGRRR